MRFALEGTLKDDVTKRKHTVAGWNQLWHGLMICQPYTSFRLENIYKTPDNALTFFSSRSYRLEFLL
jgi:hypothetical protein